MVQSVCSAIRAPLVALNESVLRLSLGGRLGIVFCTITVLAIALMSVRPGFIADTQFGRAYRAEVVQSMEERERAFHAEQEASRRIGPWTFESLSPETRGAIISTQAGEDISETGHTPTLNVTCIEKTHGERVLAVFFDFGIMGYDRALIEFDGGQIRPYRIESVDDLDFVYPIDDAIRLTLHIAQHNRMTVGLANRGDRRRSPVWQFEFPTVRGDEAMLELYAACGSSPEMMQELQNYLRR